MQHDELRVAYASGEVECILARTKTKVVEAHHRVILCQTLNFLNKMDVFKCCECGKDFGFAYNLRKHARKYHPGKSTTKFK